MTRRDHVFVARDRELADLEEQLLEVGGHGAAQAGRAALTLVDGPSGVGKSALMTRLVERAGADTQVRRARAASWEAGHPYGVLRQLGVEAGEPFAAASELVALVGDRPALVIVDDAHWADVESLQALSTLVRHHPSTPVLVLLAGRAGEATAGTADLLARSATQVLELAALEPGEVAELAAGRGVVLHPSMAERLTRHTRGNPGHVLALLAELPRSTWSALDPQLPAPESVAASVRERLASCEAPTRALVESAAVLRYAEVGELGRHAGLDDPLAALDEATAAGLVRAGGTREPVRADPMVAAAVLAAMGTRATAQAHRRAATIVDDPVRRLRHLVAAATGPDAELAGQLEELAAARAAEGEWGTAAVLLRDASRLSAEQPLRDDRLLRAVDALVGAGDVLAATALIPVVESLRETPLRNAVLGYLAIIRGRAAEAETRLDRAWEIVNAERHPDIAALICQRYVLHTLSRCRGAELVTWADRAIELAGPDAPAAVEAAAIRGLGVAGSGHPSEASSGYRTLAARIRHGAQAQRVTMGKGWLHLALDELDDARSELESAVPTTFLGGSMRISLWAQGWLARAQFVTGDWDEALRTVERGDELAGRTGMVLATPLLHWTATQVHALRGSWELADEALRSAETITQDYEIMRVPCLLARAQIAEARADYAAVLRALTLLTKPRTDGDLDEPGFWPWPDVYANALVLEGRYGDADAFLRPHEELAVARGHRSARARLGYARGRLLGALGDLDAARASFESSLALLADLPLRWDRARVNFAYGQTLRRAGKRREADAVISTARDLYAGLGATTYVQRCDRELKAGGLNVVRAGRGMDELTPQEQAVADLVAAGMTNREVAAELYLSMKTVQYHLTRIYAKLGIRSRSELAALRRTTSEEDHDDPTRHD